MGDEMDKYPTYEDYLDSLLTTEDKKYFIFFIFERYTKTTMFASMYTNLIHPNGR